jgi:hypothetical protein
MLLAGSIGTVHIVYFAISICRLAYIDSEVPENKNSDFNYS